MQFVVRFDRQASATGPDAVLLSAHHFRESYHEGQLVAYLFLDDEERLVALVRAAQVVYIAVAGSVSEPGRPTPHVADETADVEIERAESAADR